MHVVLLSCSTWVHKPTAWLHWLLLLLAFNIHRATGVQWPVRPYILLRMGGCQIGGLAGATPIFDCRWLNCCGQHAATPVTDCGSICLAESGAWPHGHGHLSGTCMRRDYAHTTQCHCRYGLNILACHCTKAFCCPGYAVPPICLGCKLQHMVLLTTWCGWYLWIRSFLHGSLAYLG